MSQSAFFDIRMKGFRNRAEVDDVIALLDQRIAALAADSIPTQTAWRRVLVEEIVADGGIPC
mgnify:CR=1 FL=1